MITPIPSIEISRVARPIPDVAASTLGVERPTDSFASVLGNAINQVNATQLNADAAVQQMLTGQGGDIHQVMLAMEQARMSMMLVSTVRDKVLEAYQEISRMPL
jgi:flagellar hook-basal body complex protein FliE